MAWRRYHIPINDEWIALGDEHGADLRQADVITFAMPPIVATKFPTPVSIVAAPVAKAHDASSVVQNKKGTKTKPKKKTQNTHKGNWAPYTAVFSCCLCVRALASFCS